LKGHGDDDELKIIREEIREFLKSFPLYEKWVEEMDQLEK